MPRCPSCGKGGFRDDAAVAMHISQPTSGCNTWVNDLVRLQQELDPPIDSARRLGGRSNSPSQSMSNVPPSAEAFQSDLDAMDVDAVDAREAVVIPDGPTVEYFTGAAQIFGKGMSFVDKFNADKFNTYRRGNLYYPFASLTEWKLGQWLLRSGISMTAINDFLSLELIQGLNLSFKTAKELRSRAELLPSGPRWQSMKVPTTHPTKSPVYLYWRDPLDCIASILSHPLFASQLEFVPRRVYTTAAKDCRIYSDWITGDDAWEMQIPNGATLLGAILSSDKTNISTLSGGRVAHPLLIGLANINASTRLKLSSHSLTLTALLPVPKFIHKNKRMRGVLEDRLIHQCLDIVLLPLKQAARLGTMLPDSIGDVRYCFTLLASYICDTPEATMLAGVGGKTSPLTMAMFKQFGDPFRHERRTRQTTIAQLSSIKSKADPIDLEAFFREAQRFRLNGVTDPFWVDYPLACPSFFLTPELLHHLHKEFWDHDAKWCVNVLGAAEMDFRFSILQPVIGFRHYKGGITGLKQVTGRVHRDVQRCIIGVISGSAPAGFVTAIRALMEFRYRVQGNSIDDRELERISAALGEFHTHKETILEIGARQGQGQKNPINNWYIPKLELLQSIVPSIRRSGTPRQWTADVTEHAHVTEIKDPARSSNNNNYEPQICRHLDRMEKCRLFEFTTSLLGQTLPVASSDTESDTSSDINSDTSSDTPAITDGDGSSTPISPAYARPITNYFAIATQLRIKKNPTPLPIRTFTVGNTAIHVGYDPSIRRITVDDAAEKFGLPDLRPSLVDFLNRDKGMAQSAVHSIGGQRRASSNHILPFTEVQVWFKVRIQNTEFHDSDVVLPAQTLCCAPPDSYWTFGRYDTAIVNVDAAFKWPESGLKGHSVCQLRLILRPLGRKGTEWPWRDRFLVYVHRFDSTGRDATQLDILKRAKRANNQHLGDIVPLGQLRAFVHLIPRFGEAADRRLTHANSLALSNEFYLNKYFDKNTFHPLSLSHLV